MARIVRSEKKDVIAFYIKTNLVDENTGKTIRKQMTWTAPKDMSEAEAKKKVLDVAADFERELRENCFLGIADNEYTVEQYSKIYLEYMKKSFSPSNYLTGVQVFEYINSKIGNVKLKNLTPTFIQSYFDDVDADKKTQISYEPCKGYKELLDSMGFTYTYLRRQLKIQHSTLTRSYKGGLVPKEWADILCERTKIPFDTLFKEKKIVSEYAFLTKKKRKMFLRQMLAYAKRMRVIKENFATADFVFYTRDSDIHQIQAMDEKQAHQFYKALDECEDIRIKTSLLLFLLTGFRRGEVAGLKWSDIDFENKKITINRAALDLKSQGIVIKTPKTTKSQRCITIPKILASQLELYRDWQNELKEQVGDHYNDEGWLFTRDDGQMLHPGTYLFWLDKVLKQANLPHFTIHSLRHTNITLQILSGVPLVTVAGRAGHSRTSTTSDIYSHYVQTSDAGAAEKLDQAFSAKKVEKKKTTDIDDILALKKEAKENGFDSITEYIRFLRQSL